MSGQADSVPSSAEGADPLVYLRPAFSTVAATALGVAAYFAPPDQAPVAWLEWQTNPPPYHRGDVATNATTFTERRKLDAIEQLFSVRNHAVLREFLAPRPELAVLLIEALFAVKRFFPDVVAALELTSDPEGERTGLTVLLPTSQSTDEALSALEAFDKAWWLGNMNRASGLLSVSLEYA